MMSYEQASARVATEIAELGRSPNCLDIEGIVNRLCETGEVHPADEWSLLHDTLRRCGCTKEYWESMRIPVVEVQSSGTR